MKKSLLALAVVAAIPAFAQAQTSNVVMYGRLDLGYAKQTGGVLNQVQASGSRFGVRGAENLGGGTFATFQIEHRFNADTGALTNQKFWHGRSIVGLRGGFGEINLGHNYTPLFWVNLAADPFGWDTVAAMNNTQTGTQVRFSNSLEYVTPSLGGLVGRLMWAPSEVAGRSANLGLSAAYSGGPLYIGLGYEAHGHNGVAANGVFQQTSGALNGTATLASTAAALACGATPSPNPTTGAAVSTSVNTNVVTAGTIPGCAQDNKSMAVTASYNFGFMRLLANFGQTDVNSIAGTPQANTLGVRHANLAAIVPMGNGEFRATFGNQTTRTTAPTSISSANLRDMGLGYHHNLSNRTTLYVDVNRGTTKTTTGASTVSASVTSYDFGLKHNF